MQGGGRGEGGLPFASDEEGEGGRERLTTGRRGREESKGQEGGRGVGEGEGEGALEDCAPLARCSARGGLLPLEPEVRR